MTTTTAAAATAAAAAAAAAITTTTTATPKALHVPSSAAGGRCEFCMTCKNVSSACPPTRQDGWCNPGTNCMQPEEGKAVPSPNYHDPGGKLEQVGDLTDRDETDLEKQDVRRFLQLDELRQLRLDVDAPQAPAAGQGGRSTSAFGSVCDQTPKATCQLHAEAAPAGAAAALAGLHFPSMTCDDPGTKTRAPFEKMQPAGSYQAIRGGGDLPKGLRDVWIFMYGDSVMRQQVQATIKQLDAKEQAERARLGLPAGDDGTGAFASFNAFKKICKQGGSDAAPGGAAFGKKEPLSKFSHVNKPNDWDLHFPNVVSRDCKPLDLSQPVPAAARDLRGYGEQDESEWHYPHINVTLTYSFKQYIWQRYDRWLLRKYFAKRGAPDIFVLSPGIHDCYFFEHKCMETLFPGYMRERINVLADNMARYLPDRTKVVWIGNQITLADFDANLMPNQALTPKQSNPQYPGFNDLTVLANVKEAYGKCLTATRAAAREVSAKYDWAFIDRALLDLAMFQAVAGPDPIASSYRATIAKLPPVFMTSAGGSWPLVTGFGVFIFDQGIHYAPGVISMRQHYLNAAITCMLGKDSDRLSDDSGASGDGDASMPSDVLQDEGDDGTSSGSASASASASANPVRPRHASRQQHCTNLREQTGLAWSPTMKKCAMPHMTRECAARGVALADCPGDMARRHPKLFTCVNPDDPDTEVRSFSQLFRTRAKQSFDDMHGTRVPFSASASPTMAAPATAASATLDKEEGARAHLEVETDEALAAAEAAQRRAAAASTSATAKDRALKDARAFETKADKLFKDETALDANIARHAKAAINGNKLRGSEGSKPSPARMHDEDAAKVVATMTTTAAATTKGPSFASLCHPLQPTEFDAMPEEYKCQCTAIPGDFADERMCKAFRSKGHKQWDCSWDANAALCRVAANKPPRRDSSKSKKLKKASIAPASNKHHGHDDDDDDDSTSNIGLACVGSKDDCKEFNDGAQSMQKALSRQGVR